MPLNPNDWKKASGSALDVGALFRLRLLIVFYLFSDFELLFFFCVFLKKVAINRKTDQDSNIERQKMKANGPSEVALSS